MPPVCFGRGFLLVPYSPTSGKEDSANFAITEFLEVRTRLQKMATCLWWKGRCPAWGSGSGGRKVLILYLVSLIRRHPLITFFVLAFVLSWWPWILYSFDLVPNPIVGFGPFLAALVVLAVTEGKSGVIGLLRRMVHWRVGLR